MFDSNLHRKLLISFLYLYYLYYYSICPWQDVEIKYTKLRRITDKPRVKIHHLPFTSSLLPTFPANLSTRYLFIVSTDQYFFSFWITDSARLFKLLRIKFVSRISRLCEQNYRATQNWYDVCALSCIQQENRSADKLSRRELRTVERCNVTQVSRNLFKSDKTPSP